MHRRFKKKVLIDKTSSIFPATKGLSTLFLFTSPELLLHFPSSFLSYPQSIAHGALALLGLMDSIFSHLLTSQAELSYILGRTVQIQTK